MFPLIASIYVAALAATARAFPFTAEVSLHYSGSDDVPSLVLSGGGTSTDGPAGAFTLPAGSITGTGSVDPTSPAVLPTIAGLDLFVATGEGSFAPGTPFGGTMSLGGVLTQFYFSRSPGFGVMIPLDGVGVGGSEPYSSPVGGGTVSGTITGAPWAIGSVGTTDNAGTQTASGFDARTPDGLGAVRLVTSFDVSTNILAGPSIGGIATLDLNFVPEPDTAMLLATGLCALAGYDRRRRQRNESWRPPRGRRRGLPS